MGVLRMYWKWRSGYWRPIEIDANGAGISQHLDAVEYELKSLNRDLARIGVDRTERHPKSRMAAG
jgi:hypothetical protein